MEHVFELGSKLRDRVSGFVGVAVSRTDYLHDTTRYGLQAQVADPSKVPEIGYFGVGNLEVA